MKILYITDVSSNILNIIDDTSKEKNISGHIPSYILSVLKKRISVCPIYSRSRFRRSFLKLFLESFIKTIKYKPDIIHGFCANTFGLIAVLVGSLLKIKTVVHVRGSDVKIFPKKNIFFKFLVNFVLQHSGGIIAVGHGLKKNVESFGVNSSKVHVIYSGVSNIFFAHQDKKKLRKKLNLPSDQKILINVARIEKLKGIQDVLVSLSEVNDKWLFVIVGSGSYEDELKQLTKDLEIDDKVKFIGPVVYEKLPLYYQASDISISTSYSEGGGPTVLYEAMASGLPVISSKTGEAPILLKKDNGILVDAGNKEQIKDAIKKLLKDGKLRKKMGEKNFKEAKSFKREDVPQKVIEVYKKLLEN